MLDRLKKLLQQPEPYSFQLEQYRESPKKAQQRKSTVKPEQVYRRGENISTKDFDAIVNLVIKNFQNETHPAEKNVYLNAFEQFTWKGKLTTFRIVKVSPILVEPTEGISFYALATDKRTLALTAAVVTTMAAAAIANDPELSKTFRTNLTDTGNYLSETIGPKLTDAGTYLSEAIGPKLIDAENYLSEIVGPKLGEAKTYISEIASLTLKDAGVYLSPKLEDAKVYLSKMTLIVDTETLKSNFESMINRCQKLFKTDN